MNILQYQEAIYWIYDKLEATIANPIPSIQKIQLYSNWIGLLELKKFQSVSCQIALNL